MSGTDALAQTYDHTKQLMSKVKPEQLTAQSPCSEWDVNGLIGHMVTSVYRLGCVAAGEQPEELAISGDVATQFTDVAKANLDAWSRPGTLEQQVNLGFGPVPGAVAYNINVLDVAVHAWDLAKATGQPTDLPPAVLAAAADAAKMIVSDQMRPGRFNPAIEPPAGASETDLLMAWLGRQP